VVVNPNGIGCTVSCTVSAGSSTKTIDFPLTFYPEYPGNPVAINGPDLICPSATHTYSLNYLPPNATWQWTLSHNLQKISETNNSVVVSAAAGMAGVATIAITFTTIAGVTITRPLTFWAGKPNPGMIQGPVNVPIGPWSHFIIEDYAGLAAQKITWYDWTVTPKLQFTRPHLMRSDAYVTGASTGRATIGFVSQNVCGSTTVSMPVMVTQPSYYAFSPNPVNTTLTVEQLGYDEAAERAVLAPVATFDATPMGTGEAEEYTIELWHEKKGKMKMVKSKNKAESIDLSKLNKGTYFLHIITPTAIYKEQLIKE
jgi:hypothetical protein